MFTGLWGGGRGAAAHRHPIVSQPTEGPTAAILLGAPRRTQLREGKGDGEGGPLRDRVWESSGGRGRGYTSDNGVGGRVSPRR